MSKSKLYLFVGYPGAGKTTVAKLIEEATGATHIWADQERQKMFETVTHSQQESGQLYKALNDRTAELLANGKSVIFDTNFNYRKDRDHLRSIADKYGAEVVIIWMVTPKALAKDRALHENHRDRNGYEYTMPEADFERLSNHLEAPHDDERAVKLDGSNLDVAATRQLFSM